MIDLKSLAVQAGMMEQLNQGAASCVYSEGCNGVAQDHLQRFAALVAQDGVADLLGENKVLRELIALAIPVLETIEPECDSERVEMLNLLSRLKNAIYAEEREQQISLLGAEKEPCRFPSCQFVGCPAGGCYGSRP